MTPQQRAQQLYETLQRDEPLGGGRNIVALIAGEIDAAEREAEQRTLAAVAGAVRDALAGLRR